MSFVICHLSFVIRHLSFVICHLSFVRVCGLLTKLSTVLFSFVRRLSNYQHGNLSTPLVDSDG
ncbi:hypothetical protein [Coleofasciculus sp. F4-SAH-05]|uniref:hypothetical protein n=1 Tax=Coleofasciculus sp. F4-SAH-05 TaxID=3069525 RepID=UPI0032F13F48